MKKLLVFILLFTLAFTGEAKEIANYKTEVEKEAVAEEFVKVKHHSVGDALYFAAKMGTRLYIAKLCILFISSILTVISKEK